MYSNILGVSLTHSLHDMLENLNFPNKVRSSSLSPAQFAKSQKAKANAAAPAAPDRREYTCSYYTTSRLSTANQRKTRHAHLISYKLTSN